MRNPPIGDLISGRRTSLLQGAIAASRTYTEPPNWSAHLARYRAEGFLKVEGWLHEAILDALAFVQAQQIAHRVSGDALEIGVHHGRFFLALAACLAPAEHAVAVDVFDEQALNVDRSGSGAFKIFSENVALYAPNPASVRSICGDSLLLDPGELLSQSPSGAYRLISIDGGHTVHHVANDLRLSASIINGGGVVFLDDLHNPHWPGVIQGFLKYMWFENSNLAPFLFVGNKLLLTTISHHRVYFEAARQFPLPSGWWFQDTEIAGFRVLSANS